MKKWTDLTSLGLLDDSAEPEIPARAFELLVREPAPAPLSTSARPAGPTSNRAASQTPAPRPEKIAPRVFSSRPTLRQMMGEYNRRTPAPAPIKCHNPSEGRDVFRFQSVDLIQLPNIPGKILRPTRS